MLEKLYEPIPDIEEYLARINVKSDVRADKDFLDELIYAHQCLVPFENLDIGMFKKEIKLGVTDIFEKVVTNRRGGFCFELNHLFYSLLKAVGFDVHPCKVKVCKDNVKYSPPLHRGNIVKFGEDLYYCDVGFGGPIPGGALKIEEGTRQEIHGDIFFFRRENEQWWIMYRISSSGEEQRFLRINPMPVEVEDFVPFSHYCSCHEQRYFNEFTDKIITNIRTEHGHYSIDNQKLIKNINGERSEVGINSDEELRRILKEYFLIDLKD